MKTYRQHPCDRRHRSYRTTAACMFKRAAWISGEGPYALLAWCGTLTVTLHESETAARGTLTALNRTACGHRCSARHEVVQIVLP